MNQVNVQEKVVVEISGKQVRRNVVKKKGDRYVRHKNELFLLHPREDKIMHPVTSNYFSYMWDKQYEMDVKMCNMDRIPKQHTWYVPTVVRHMRENFDKNSDFLYEHYPTDASCMDEWLTHAFETLNIK